MKKLILAAALSFVFGGMAYAKPAFVKGAKCVACHTEAMGKKTNVSDTAKAMLKKYPDQKCADCHAPADGGKKLACTDEKACKK